jgi:nitrous oxide reductase accessory protein NosL
MKQEIKNLKQAKKYCEEMQYCLEKPEIKFQMFFRDDKTPFNFSTIQEVIDWCEEDRQKVEEIN